VQPAESRRSQPPPRTVTIDSMPSNPEPHPTPDQPPALAAVFRRRDANLALAAAAVRWDYDRLDLLASNRAEQLARAGLARGDAVICPVRPVAGLILMQHALLRVGAALLPFAGDPGDAGGRALIRATGAEWIWQPGRSEDAAGTGGGRLQRTEAGPGRDRHNGAAAGSAGSAPATDPITALVHTSGSGGAPKIAMLTAGNLHASAAAINARLRLGPGDAWLGVLPRQHIGGLAIGWRCALAGATLVAHDGFDVAAVRAELASPAAVPVTHLSLVPPMLARLLEAGVRPPPSLRVVLLGGQSLDPALARRALAAGWPLHLGYGMTETGSMIAGGPVGGDGETALAPLPGVELDCPACEAPAGADSSAAAPRPLRLRGPMVMAGYANPDRRRGDGLSAGGWLTTADLGCRTPDGGLRVIGRADEVLVIGGVNVLPAAVERRLAAAPGIGEVAVTGVPEPVWGHRLVALYAGPADAGALDAWCRANLPGAERPRGFRRVAGLPLLASGKVDRQALAAIAAAPADEPERGEPRLKVD